MSQRRRKQEPPGSTLAAEILTCDHCGSRYEWFKQRATPPTQCARCSAPARWRSVDASGLVVVAEWDGEYWQLSGQPVIDG